MNKDLGDVFSCSGGKNSISDITQIRRLVWRRQYEFSMHAEKERQLDMISVSEIEEALRNCDIIEMYPDDPRGESCLVAGYCGSRPVHAVCTVQTNPEELLLITVYDPSKRPDKWTEDFKKRR
ncbi:MAG: DUF4258 domain-containing protein [Pseudomonadota bacterium]